MKDFTTIFAICAGCGTVITVIFKVISSLMSRKFATTKDLDGTNKRVAKLETDSERYKQLFLPLGEAIKELKDVTVKLDGKTETQGKEIVVLSTKMDFVTAAVKRIDDGVECIRRGEK